MFDHDKQHFWISALALVGGGWIATHYPDLQGTVAPFVTLVIGHWFGAKQSNGNGNGNGSKP